MPQLVRDDVTIRYEVAGDGFPVLLIAPGGMRSTVEFWGRMPWDPTTTLTEGYRVVGMDQRNAGQSWAPVTAADGWATYTADQLALLDHLGIECCHVIGMCIGGPYVMGLLRAAPERFASAVMLQPIGLDANREAFHEMFDGWRAEVADAHPEADEAAWTSFRSNMYDGDFLFNTDRDEAVAVSTPILLLMGDDLYHPQSVSRQLADLLPDVTFVEHWKDDEVIADTDATIRRFLAAHTPAD